MRDRAIGPIGTVGRLIAGPLLIYFGFFSPLEDLTSISSLNLLSNYWDDLLVGVIVLPLSMAVLQLVWQAIKNKPLRATGNLGFIVNFAITIAMFFTPLHHAMWFYLGFSLLVAAMRGYRGCEVMAISNWVTGRNDQVGCVIFSPIDALEKTLPKHK